MNYTDWANLADSDQTNKCQELNPYEEWDVFKGVEAEFKKHYRGQSGIGEVFCGLGSSLGPVNCITVHIIKGQKKTGLPKTFMGFPVVRDAREFKRVDSQAIC
jgi:hypothetical protein